MSWSLRPFSRQRILAMPFATAAARSPATAASDPGPSAVGPGEWRQFRGGPAHRGLNIHEDILSPANVDELEVLWHGANGFNSSAAVAGGVVYVSNGALHAYPADCATDGSLCPALWTGASGYADWSSPAVSHGVVYIGGASGLYAFEVGCGDGGADCAALWTGNGEDMAYTSPTVVGGMVYVATSFGLARCL